MFKILDQKWFISSKIKNSQCGEVRSKKFFQILKKLIKTRPVMYFSSQTNNMPSRTTRITDLFNIQEGSKSPSGGNQVDGLPSASSLRSQNFRPRFVFIKKVMYDSKFKNSQCGEVRLQKFFQILKKLIKTHLMIYFSSQTDNISSRTTRITDMFNI